jgi:outer membrane protein with beta-barrel domain
MTSRAWGATLAGLLVAFCSRSAAAQTVKRVEVSAGYAFLNDLTDQVRFPMGWNLGMAAGLTSWLSLAVDAGGHYKTLSLVGTDVTLRAHTLMAGPRASARIGPFVEFGQVLAGMSHGSGTAFGSTDSVTHFAWQPGGGIDLPLGHHVSARTEFDARFLTQVHEFRFAAAIVYTWQRP